MENKNIIEKTEKYVIRLLEEKLPEQIIYHTIDHTLSVVRNAEIIGEKEGLNDEELNIVRISAWFHDTGYTIKCKGHEEESVKISTEFLAREGIDKNDIERVKACIDATAIPQNPSNKLAQVVCDADLMHLGNNEYFELAELMRKEWNKTGDKKIGKKQFENISVQFFTNHHYHTAYGKSHLEKDKQKNLSRIKKRITKRKKKRETRSGNQKCFNRKGYSRGVQSMFRLTARNQINLSSMADSKSNILISVNAIIISVAVAGLFSRFDSNPEIIIPTFIFLATCLATIIFAILSTRPNVSSGRFVKEEIKRKNVNLLFFGNFFKMSYAEYKWAVKKMIKCDEYLYSSMIQDQYSLGKVLARKYRLLRISYNIFMYGIIVSAIAFVIAFFFYHRF